MAEIRLESYQTFTAPRINTGAEKIGEAIASAGRSIGRGVDEYARNARQRQKEEEQRALAEQKKAQEQQEARDRIVAADKLGGIQREYTRQVNELDRTFIGVKSSKEYENAKKRIFDNLMAKESKNLTDTVSKEMQKSGKTWLNARLLSDLEKAYKDEAEAANAAATSYADNALMTGAAYGEDADPAGAQIAYGMTRQELKNFADKMMENSDIPMKEFDANYMMAFLTGAAKSNNPELAWDMSKPENLAAFMNKDYEKEKGYFDTLSTNLRKHLEKPLEYGRNKLAIETKRAENEKKINDSIAFMNNPIILGSMMDEKKPLSTEEMLSTVTEEDAKEYQKTGTNARIDELKSIIYKNSSNVGTGKVPVYDLHELIRQVSSITAGVDGDVDNQLLKAYYANNYLSERDASPEQIKTFNNVIAKALTDKNFKQGIAKMAGKPSFDTLFNKTTPTSFTSKQEQMNEYVQEIGRDAYFGFMDLMASGDYDGAYDFYDSKFREAYDYVKSDILDVNYVKKSLEKMGYAMVELNGNMTKIVGRDQNGEYIIENTGRKINGGY